MRKTLFLIVTAILLLAPSMQAQVREEPPAPRYLSIQKKHTVTIHPLQWFNWGWRFDYEVRLKDGPGWLQFGPSFYWVTKDMDKYRGVCNEIRKSLHDSFTKMKGGGLDVNYKRFIDARRGSYVAGGLSYTLFNIDYWGGRGEWKDYIEDGLPYHQYIYTVGAHTQTIHRLCMNTYYGYQIPSSKTFLFDVFAGLSYRHPILDKNKQLFDSYSLSYGYGYKGLAWTTGIRIGFGVK